MTAEESEVYDLMRLLLRRGGIRIGAPILVGGLLFAFGLGELSLGFLLIALVIIFSGAALMAYGIYELNKRRRHARSNNSGSICVMQDGVPLARRILGVSLILAGPIFFAVLIPFVVSLGLLGVILLTWLVVICVSLGTFMFLPTGFRRAVRSLFIVLILFLPWFAIFLIAIPSDAQLLLAVFVAGIAILLYRYYYDKRHSSVETHRGS